MNANNNLNAAEKSVVFRAIVRWILGGIVLLGIGYRFILPFTPYWIDVLVFVAVGSILVFFGIKAKKEKQEKAQSTAKPGQPPNTP